MQKLLFLGFFIAFAIKAPLVPFHTWLPDSGAEAPIGGAVLLVGVLDKVGTFGFLRYCLPLFPDASRYFAPFVLVLAVVGILYAALLAMGQSDMKRLVAYTSISHFGFIALGIFAFTTEAATGAVLYMVNHGIATGLLFLVVGMLIARGGSRQIGDYGGVAAKAPLLAGRLPARRPRLPGAARDQQLRQRVPRADRLVPDAAGLHDHRDVRHHPGRALHPADVPAHDARPAPRACCSRPGTPSRTPVLRRCRGGARRSTATLPAPRRPCGCSTSTGVSWRSSTPLVALIIVLGVYPQPLLNLIEPAVARHHESTSEGSDR